MSEEPGFGLGPHGWNAPMHLPRESGVEVRAKRGLVAGTLRVCWLALYWSVAVTVILCWYLVKYVAIGVWWVSRELWMWWKTRQGETAAVEATKREYDDWLHGHTLGTPQAAPHGASDVAWSEPGPDAASPDPAARPGFAPEW